MEKLYGLLGRKLGHSFSVPIHNYFGCHNYRLYEVEPDALEGFLRQPNIGGVNVTIPYKLDAMRLCDELDESAVSVGAVNVVVNRGGRLIGYNTDKYGFEYAMKSAGFDVRGKKVLVLGSGGASKAVQAGLKSLGAGETIVISRSGENNYGNLNRQTGNLFIINTTPVGMYPDCELSPLPRSFFEEHSIEGVLDVIYNPLRTRLILECGVPSASGLSMLVAQAKAADELFFDTSIDDELINKCLNMLRRERENIVLIGMPGCGKTTVGREIAKLSGRPFVDIDEYITNREKRSPSEIIRSDGENTFREIETDAMRDVLRVGGQVVATGGGAVERSENMYSMRQNGTVYWLKTPLELLKTDDRPLSSGGIEKVKQLWERRKGMYESMSDCAVDTDATGELAAAEIWRKFNEDTCN